MTRASAFCGSLDRMRSTTRLLASHAKSEAMNRNLSTRSTSRSSVGAAHEVPSRKLSSLSSSLCKATLKPCSASCPAPCVRLGSGRSARWYLASSDSTRSRTERCGLSSASRRAVSAAAPSTASCVRRRSSLCNATRSTAASGSALCCKSAGSRKSSTSVVRAPYFLEAWSVCQFTVLVARIAWRRSRFHRFSISCTRSRALAMRPSTCTSLESLSFSRARSYELIRLDGSTWMRLEDRLRLGGIHRTPEAELGRFGCDEPRLGSNIPALIPALNRSPAKRLLCSSPGSACSSSSSRGNAGLSERSKKRARRSMGKQMRSSSLERSKGAGRGASGRSASRSLVAA